jgi:hypothetical protein
MAASAASAAACGQTRSRLWPPGGGVRPDHPTPTGRPPISQ